MPWIEKLMTVLVASGVGLAACDDDGRDEETGASEPGCDDAAAASAECPAPTTSEGPPSGDDEAPAGSTGGSDPGSATSDPGGGATSDPGGEASSGGAPATSTGANGATDTGATTGEAVECCPEECWASPCDCADGNCCWLTPHPKCC